MSLVVTASRKRKATALSRTLKKRRFIARIGTRSTSEQLSGDGTTWTLEMAVPRSRFANEARVLSINQTYYISNFFATSASTPTFTAASFSFNQIDQYAALASVFDQYRIDAVEVWLQPEVSEAVSSAYGTLFSVIDLDDSTFLTSIGQAQDYASCVTSPAKNGHFRRFVPHIAMAAYGSSFNQFANMKPQWIDTSSPAVLHYGVKFAAAIASAVFSYDLVIRYKVSLRCIR